MIVTSPSTWHLGGRERRVDAGLSALLALQGFTLFAAIPLSSGWAWGEWLLDGCHAAFTAICIGVLTRRWDIRVGLVAVLAALFAGHLINREARHSVALTGAAQHEIIAMVAFVFNAGVTALVARHVFTDGKVTVHRVRGAILLYLNVAALFSIAYSVVDLYEPGAFAWSMAGRLSPLYRSNAAFSYFSLVTITTTGYGDIAPVHPLARSLANLEAIFGQLFPATLLARLVTLHLIHEGKSTQAPRSGS